MQFVPKGSGFMLIDLEYEMLLTGLSSLQLFSCSQAGGLVWKVQGQVTVFLELQEYRKAILFLDDSVLLRNKSIKNTTVSYTKCDFTGLCNQKCHVLLEGMGWWVKWLSTFTIVPNGRGGSCFLTAAFSNAPAQPGESLCTFWPVPWQTQNRSCKT